MNLFVPLWNNQCTLRKHIRTLWLNLRMQAGNAWSALYFHRTPVSDADCSTQLFINDLLNSVLKALPGRHDRLIFVWYKIELSQEYDTLPTAKFCPTSGVSSHFIAKANRMKKKFLLNHYLRTHEVIKDVSTWRFPWHWKVWSGLVLFGSSKPMLHLYLYSVPAILYSVFDSLP